MEYLPHPYKPFIPEGAVRLILGSAPPQRFFVPKQLLEKDVDFFYGSSNNLLWPALGEVFQAKFSYNNSVEAVKERKEFLAKHKFGILDIFATLARKDKTASDTSLVAGEYVELLEILKENEGIRTIYCTSNFVMQHLGKYYYQVTGRYLPKAGPASRKIESGNRVVEVFTLYSPSPAASRAGITQSRRILQYRNLLVAQP